MTTTETNNKAFFALVKDRQGDYSFRGCAGASGTASCSKSEENMKRYCAQNNYKLVQLFEINLPNQ